MTQTTSTTMADLLPVTAMVTWAAGGTFALRYFPIESVESGREQFGPTLDDARLFVATSCCNECGTAKEDIISTVWDRACQGCGVTGCMCVLHEDAHQGDTYWCGDCQPYCGCRYCSDD